jgi:aryl-alcohol dehydrogenase-like predicted oxidoreductase/enamine deaminase RidA (YjgF/YER057c/UK114 family)
MSRWRERIGLGPGLTISRVVTGLWQIADMERDGRPFDRAAAERAMAGYLDAGFTTFDMADHYGSAEEIAGGFRSSLSEPAQVQLGTKWVPGPGAAGRSEVRVAVERSLRRLGVERIDLLQFHAWSYPHPEWLDALFHLAELRNEGLIGNLGLTNFDPAHLRVAIASGVPIVSNQISWSLIDRRAAGAMSDYCLATGVRVLAYGTLLGGFLSERWLGRPEPDWDRLGTWSEMKYGRFIRAAGGWDRFQAVLRAANTVADRHGVSIANVACRYVLDQPAVGAIIVGARLGQRDHVADTLRLASLSLEDTDRALLEEAVAHLDPIPGKSGDEYRKPPFLTAAGDLSHHVAEWTPPYPVERGADGVSRALSGTSWESIAGFCRGIRIGDRVLISGTTATHGSRLVGGTDPAAQFHAAADKIEGALLSLGASLADVVRTRVFIRDIAHWEPVARAHGDRFGAIRPANTLVQAELVGESYLVEVEAEAQVRP